MHEPNSGLEVDDDSDERGLDLTWLTDLVGKLRRHIRLLVLMLPFGLALAATLFVLAPRSYEADALIGPRGPSPTDTMLSSIGGAGTAGVARRLLGGVQSGGSDPYQEYLQLLPSTRLAQVLIDKYHLDRVIFSKQWDNEKGEWKTSSLQPYKDAIKRLLGMPVSREPGVDRMMKFFDANLSIAGVSSGMASSLIPGSSTYTSVVLKFDDPQQAVYILDTILIATDQIIRDDERRDVDARIATLKKEIAAVTNSDEQGALIDVLTSQEQLQTMIKADHRYASTLVVTPYASDRPKYPTISSFAFGGIVGSLALWIGLILLGTRFQFVHAYIRHFEKKDMD